jgi:hypothetical protein
MFPEKQIRIAGEDVLFPNYEISGFIRVHPWFQLLF